MWELGPRLELETLAAIDAHKCALKLGHEHLQPDIEQSQDKGHGD